MPIPPPQYLPQWFPRWLSPTGWLLRIVHQRLHRAGFIERHLHGGDLTLRYHVGGGGPPLLLLHGFGGDGVWTWHPQLVHLSRTHRVIVPDLLWFGGSDGPGLEPGLDAQVRAIRSLLDAEGVGRADIAAISYGGFVAFHLLKQHPERVDRLAIVDSPGPPYGSEDLQAALDRLGVSAISQIFVPGSGRAVGRILDLCLYRARWMPQALLADIRAWLFARHPIAQHALLADLMARIDDDDWPRPDRGLVLWGAHDPLFPIALGARLATWMGAPLVRLDRTAHAPNLERPRAFNRALSQFLAS